MDGLDSAKEFVVEAFGLTKAFNKAIVFQNVDFCVRPGEVVSILGPSGCGKTTLLRCLVGLEKVDKGTIIVDGFPLVQKGLYCKAKDMTEVFSSVGFVFQNFELFVNLTVLQNLLIVKHSLEKAECLLRRFGLLEKRDNFISSLSGGQKQRLAICRALMRQPKILFFDEPTSALDNQNSDEICKLVKELSSEGYAVVVVTHDMNFVSKLEFRAFNLVEHN